MSLVSEDRLHEAKAKDILQIAQELAVDNLRRTTGPEWVGPCPECGGDDRFSINTRKQVYFCRRCDAKGDVVQLVRWRRGLTLPQAVDWLIGAERDITPEERRIAREKADRNAREREDRSAKERAAAIAAARKIWRAGVSPEGTAVRDYLTRRGFGPDLLPEIPRCLRFHPDLPYMVPGPDRGRYVEVHRGPAMLAVIQRPDMSGSAVHRTWLDLSQPKGKAVITAPDGVACKVKKTLGSKKGGVIRLRTPLAFDTLVMGEGIETTLTAMVSGQWPDAAFWAAVDLGNIAGRRQSGVGLKFAGLPDMADDEAWQPPPWLKTLILIEDGDSDPRDTRAKLESGARRAMALVPGLRALIVPCPAGRDLNDVLLGDL